MLRNLIRNAEKVALSIEELRDLSQGEADIVDARYFTGFRKSNIVILFYPTVSDSFGHYSTLIYRPEKK